MIIPIITGCQTLLGAAIKYKNNVYAISVMHLLGYDIYPRNLLNTVKEVLITIDNKLYKCETVTSNLIPDMIQTDDTWDTTGDFICFRPMVSSNIQRYKSSMLYNNHNIPSLEEDILVPGSKVYICNKNDHTELYYGHISSYMKTHLLVEMCDDLINLDNYSGSPIYGINGKIIGLLSGADILNINNKNNLYLDCISSLTINEYMSFIVKE